MREEELMKSFCTHRITWAQRRGIVGSEAFYILKTPWRGKYARIDLWINLCIHYRRHFWVFLCSLVDYKQYLISRAFSCGWQGGTTTRWRLKKKLLQGSPPPHPLLSPLFIPFFPVQRLLGRLGFRLWGFHKKFIPSQRLVTEREYTCNMSASSPAEKTGVNELAAENVPVERFHSGCQLSARFLLSHFTSSLSLLSLSSGT